MMWLQTLVLQVFLFFVAKMQSYSRAYFKIARFTNAEFAFAGRLPTYALIAACLSSSNTYFVGNHEHGVKAYAELAD